MATLYGKYRTDYSQDVPNAKVDASLDRGRLRVSYDEYTFESNASSGDVIKMMKLPKGARVYQVILHSNDGLDASSTDIDVGWDGGVNGNETADEDGFIAAYDGGSGAFVKKMVADGATAALPAGYAKKFADEVSIDISLDAALDGSDTETISLEVHWAID